MVNPFEPKTVLLAKHAQHVVLIHFPIALFITGVAFDFLAWFLRKPGLADVAYYDVLLAALTTIPVVATGLLAWQLQLEGQKLKGLLLLHLVLGLLSTAAIWWTWWLHYRSRRRKQASIPALRLAIETVGVLLVALTGHLGGFLSGVNSPA